MALNTPLYICPLGSSSKTGIHSPFPQDFPLPFPTHPASPPTQYLLGLWVSVEKINWDEASCLSLQSVFLGRLPGNTERLAATTSWARSSIGTTTLSQGQLLMPRLLSAQTENILPLC